MNISSEAAKKHSCRAWEVVIRMSLILSHASRVDMLMDTCGLVTKQFPTVKFIDSIDSNSQCSNEPLLITFWFIY